MHLAWRSRPGDDNLEGYDDRNRLRAQVVRYDVPPAWQAFVSGHRVEGGPWETSEAASAAAEAALGRVRAE